MLCIGSLGSFNALEVSSFFISSSLHLLTLFFFSFFFDFTDGKFSLLSCIMYILLADF